MPEGLRSGAAYVEITVDTSKFTKDLKRSIRPALANAEKTSNSAMSGVAGAAAKIAKVGAVAFGAAAIGAIGAIGKMGMEYQNSLNIFQAATSATAAQMDKVKKAARELGNDITLPGLSAKDAAAAMTELAKGGLSVEQSMQAAKGTLQLATAAQIDGAQAAEIQANALAMFGLGANEATHVADSLANAANAASGEITDFAEALKYVGSLARGLHVGIDDVNSTLGVLANNGIKGSQAGTSVRSMLASLADPSKEAKKAMDGLSLTVYDAQGNFKGMRVLIEQLTKAQKEMTQAEYIGLFAKAFGKEALPAAISLANSGTVAFDSMSKAIKRQGGAAQLAAAKSKGLGGALDSLKSTLETAGLALYDKVAPGVEKAVRGITDAMPGALDKVGAFFTNLIDGFTSFVSSPTVASVGTTVTTMVEKFTTAFSSIVDSKTFTSIIDSVQRIADVVSGPLNTGWTNLQPVLEAIATVLGTTLGVALDAVKSTLDTLADTVEAAERNFGKIKTTVTVLATTLGVVFLPQLALATAGIIANGVAAAASAVETGILWTLYKVDAVVGLGAAVVKSWAMVGAIAASGVAAAAAAAETAILWTMYKVEAVQSLGAAVASMARLAIAYTASTIAATASAVATGATAVASGIATAAQWALNVALDACPITWIVIGIIAFVAAIILAYKNSETFRKIVQAVWGGIKKAVSVVLDWFTGTLWPGIKKVWDGIVKVLQFVWKFVGFFVKAYIAYYVFLFKTIVRIALLIKDGVVKAFQWIFKVVVPAVVGGVRAVIGFFTGLWTKLVAIVTTIKNYVVLGFKTLWALVITTVSTSVTRVLTFFSTLWTRISSFITSIKNAVVNGFRTAWSTAVSTVSGAIGSIVGYVSNLWTRISGFLKTLGSNIAGAFRTLWNGAVTAVGAGIGAVVTAVGKVKDAIVGVFKNAGTWLKDAGERIIKGIAAGWDGLKKWLAGKWKAIVDILPDKVAEWLQLKSPSRVMARLGELIGNGLALGIAGSRSAVEAATEQLAAAVTGTDMGVLQTPEIEPGRAGRPRAAFAGGGPVEEIRGATRRFEPSAAVNITVNGAVDANAVGRQIVDLLKREGRFRNRPVLAG